MASKELNCTPEFKTLIGFETKQMNNLSKIVVFGASGFLGEHIIRHLVSNNFDVHAIVRTKPKYSTDTFDRTQVTYYEADLQDCESIKQVMEDADGIIFSAGCTWKPYLAISEYYRENVQITENFFTALGDRPDVRVVYTSSMSAVAGSNTPFIFSEDSDRSYVSESSLSPYDRAKIECEQIALDYAKRGNNLVILNPGYMLGPGAFNDSKITTSALVLEFCQKKSPIYINGGHSFCDVRDVAKAHVAALTHGHSGDRYILAGHNLEMAGIYHLMAKMTGLSSPSELPAQAVYPLSLLLEGLSLFSFNLFKNPYHPQFLKAASLYYYADSKKAINELGYTITPIETALLDTIRYFFARNLLPEDFRFFEEMTPSNAQALVYLRQLARSHPLSHFLLEKIPEIYRVCEANHCLNDTLAHLLTNSKFNDKAGRFQIDRAKCKDEIKTLNQLFEYLYFASDDFISGVL